VANHQILINTATLYNRLAKNNKKYITPSNVLNGAIKQFGLIVGTNSNEIINSDQYVVVRSQEGSGEREIIRHPLDLVEKGIEAGVDSLRSSGMLEKTHICLIAVPRSSLTSTFTLIYEVVRRCGWSVLPLGGSTDGQDISKLCSAFKVDTIIIAADSLNSVFESKLIGQFDSVKKILYVSGTPTQEVLSRINSEFPQLEIHPFLYQSDITGPVGLPVRSSENDKFDVLDNVLLEVESKEGEMTLNGSGRLLVSVLGLEQPVLIRRDIGDFGMLKTDDDGKQTIQLNVRKNI
jgi:hypothetical protein